MKAFIVISMAAALFSTTTIVSAQDLRRNEIPANIATAFQKAYPKARDVEWEMNNDRYKVEFETGLATDHEVWYNSDAKVIKHQEEISARALPTAIKSKIRHDFRGYRTEDVKKITTPAEIIYTMELKSLKEEWKISFDEKGNTLEKKRD